jgi:hypothetical protein
VARVLRGSRSPWRDAGFVTLRRSRRGVLTCLSRRTGVQVGAIFDVRAFNFYVQAPGGSYEFDVNAQLFVGNNNTAPASSVAGCFGPGTVTVTVEQVKNFSFNSPIGF